MPISLVRFARRGKPGPPLAWTQTPPSPSGEPATLLSLSRELARDTKRLPAVGARRAPAADRHFPPPCRSAHSRARVVAHAVAPSIDGQRRHDRVASQGSMKSEDAKSAGSESVRDLRRHNHPQRHKAHEQFEGHKPPPPPTARGEVSQGARSVRCARGRGWSRARDEASYAIGRSYACVVTPGWRASMGVGVGRRSKRVERGRRAGHVGN